MFGMLAEMSPVTHRNTLKPVIIGYAQSSASEGAGSVSVLHSLFGALLQQLLQPVIPIPAHRQPRSIAEDGYAAVFRVQLDLFDAFNVDDVAAVDADEAVGVELGGDFADGLLLAELRARGDNTDRVVGGFDVVEAGDGNDVDCVVL